MKASRKGTRLNDRHNFKQPLPHLRNRMTAMCVLSKISGLQDKIQATKDHDLIVGKTERNLKSSRGKIETIRNDLFEFGKNDRYEERELSNSNKVTIKIGLERTFVENGISYNKQEKRDVADIIRHLKNNSIISVGQINANECTKELRDDKDDCEYHGYCVSIKSPLPAVPPKRIGPILQHWESMIGQKLGTLDSKYTSNDMQMIDDNTSEKSSQFPSKAELLAKKTAARINTFFNNKHNINNKNRGCDVAMKTTKDIESSTSESKGGKLKRMALELLDILVANKKNANDIPSPTIISKQISDSTRMKTIYERIPNYEKSIKDRYIRRRNDINISRIESISQISKSTIKEDANKFTDTETTRSSLHNKPSNFDDWLIRELRSRQGIRLQL